MTSLASPPVAASATPADLDRLAALAHSALADIVRFRRTYFSKDNAR